MINVTSQSNRAIFGNNNITDTYVKVDWTVTSDARDKTNFEEVPHGLNFIKQLKPFSFKFKKSRDEDIPVGKKRYGFKAQDILMIEGEDPVIIDNEDPNNLKYKGESLVPILVNAIKEQQELIDSLKLEIQNLKP